jgi:rubredoxin
MWDLTSRQKLDQAEFAGCDAGSKIVNMADAFEPEEIDGEPTVGELEEWARATEQVMSKCANSQPYEEGEPIWINGHGPLRDALDIAGVPEEHFELVAERVHCPCCGNRYELFEEVGIKATNETRFEELRANWLMEHQERLEDFYSHLEEYPYLGLAHEFGREINDSLDELPRRILTESWYRARRQSSRNFPQTFQRPSRRTDLVS